MIFICNSFIFSFYYLFRIGYNFMRKNLRLHFNTIYSYSSTHYSYLSNQQNLGRHHTFI